MSNNTRSLVEAAFISAIVVVLMIVMQHIPILNYMIFAIPSAFALVWFRRGRKYGILSILDSVIILMIFGFVIESVFVLIYGGLMTAVISENIMRKKQTSMIIFASSMVAFIALFAMLYFMQLITGISFSEAVTTSIEETKTILSTMPSDVFIKENMDKQINIMEFTFKQFLPSIIFFCAFCVSSINYMVTKWSFKRFLNINIKNGYFRHFTLKPSLIYGIFFLMISAYILKNIGFDPSGAVGDNVLSISFFALYIQGLAVLAFIMHIKKWTKGTKIFVIIGCILFMGMLQIFFVLLGASELVFGMRNRMHKLS